jgi:hypothetical protein
LKYSAIGANINIDDATPPHIAIRFVPRANLVNHVQNSKIFVFIVSKRDVVAEAGVKGTVITCGSC